MVFRYIFKCMASEGVPGSQSPADFFKAAATTFLHSNKPYRSMERSIAIETLHKAFKKLIV